MQFGVTANDCFPATNKLKLFSRLTLVSPPYAVNYKALINETMCADSFKVELRHAFATISFQGKVEMTLEVMPKTEAELKPAGEGREDPNKNPTLDEPK